jgi:tetratricopeptide (TPR) repeat protein
MIGCDLDTQMYNAVTEDVIKKPSNYASFANGSYRLLKNDGGITENGYRFATYGGDELSISGSTTDELICFFTYNRDETSERTEYAWELGYRTIGNCNQAIELYDAMSNPDIENTIIAGEQYYLRGLVYFQLINMFGQPYVNNPEQHLGLPIKLTTDPNDYPKEGRSTVAKVYQQIESDLLKAVELMTIPVGGPEPKSHCYATKEAAEALLARVYLYMERWDEAKTYADAVINSGRFSLLQGEEYTKYPQYKPEDNKETIFAVRRTKDKDSDGSDQPGSMYINLDGSGWEEIYASARYMDLLELHPEDLRNKFIVKRNPKSDQLRFVYSRQKAGSVAYEYGKINVTRSGDTYIMPDSAAANFMQKAIQQESYYLGTRYYITAIDGTKYVGRIEPVIDERNDLPKYAINKCSYQEQSRHLWSPMVSRLAEMYLIRAEASAENGNIQSALDDVNVIRRRAGIPEYKTGDLSPEHDIRKVIEEERNLEFAFEGHRRFDVFRHRQSIDLRYPGYHITAASERTQIPYNDPSSCEYIPLREINNYPGGLEQNP